MCPLPNLGLTIKRAAEALHLLAAYVVWFLIPKTRKICRIVREIPEVAIGESHLLDVAPNLLHYSGVPDQPPAFCQIVLRTALV